MRDTGASGEIARTRAFWTASKAPQSVAPAYQSEPPLWWHAALSLAIALLVQSSLGPALAFRGASPPLVLLVVGWYALRAGALRALPFGLIAGACEDAFAGTTGAAWTFATAAASLCAGRFARTWAADLPPALCAGAGALTLARYAAFAVAMQLQGRPVALPFVHAQAALWQGVEATVLSALLLRFAPNLARTTPFARGQHAHRR